MIKGVKHSKETREKMRIAHLGKKLPEETKLKIALGNKGKVRTEAEKKLLSEKNKGKRSSIKTEFKKGYKPWNYEHGQPSKRKFKMWKGNSILRSHYVICKSLNIDKIPKPFVVHHIDHNGLNDEIDNLCLMTDKAHRKYHLTISKIKKLGGNLV